MRQVFIASFIVASASACATSTHLGASGGAGGAATSDGSASTTNAATVGASTSASTGAGTGGAGGAVPDPMLLGIENTQGWQIYPGGGYRYGPSIIVHGDGSIDLWTCSPGANGAWDFIRHRSSTDGGHTWSADDVALSPTPGQGDAYSTCDPGAIRINGQYYIGYTSTGNAAGTQNDLYIARAASPTGPFEKWSGTGWGNTPVPVVTYTGATDRYGIGEPSLVLQGGKLFVYYTDDDATGNYTDLATVDDPLADDWPLHLVMKGHVITHGSGQDSIDVKYDDAHGRFIAVSTFDRFTSNSTVAAYQSFDGQTFEPTPFRGARVQAGAHNMGLAGDESGHIDPNHTGFIAYAYAPPGAAWGDWPTFLDPIALTSFPLGTACGGEVSSIVGGTDWNWSGPRAWDGDAGSTFSSISHAASADATEWADIDLGRSLAVGSITITPRALGLGYPVDFSLQTSADGATFTDLPGQVFTAHPNPGASPETFTVSPPVSGRFVRLLATKLGADDAGNHYLQLGEMAVGVATP